MYGINPHIVLGVKSPLLSFRVIKNCGPELNWAVL